MLPNELCQLMLRFEGARVVPRYFSERDEGWLSALLQEYQAFVGEKRSRLRERLRAPLSVSAPRAKLRVANLLLEPLCRDRVSAEISPREARWQLFRAATSGDAPRAEVLARVAQELGLSDEALEACLFADLEGEKLVQSLPSELDAERVVALANQTLASSLLSRALEVRVRLWGEVTPFVRRVRQLGLICSAQLLHSDPEAFAVELEISGPLALFRRTQMYARALGSMLTQLASCARFELEAACVFGRAGEPRVLSLSSSDPIRQSELPAWVDSELSKRFVREFRAAAPGWELRVAPPPLHVGGKLLLPDFELVSRDAPERRYWLEIVGFWTERYLRERLRGRISGLILCVDETRGCDDPGVLAGANCVRYRTRIDPARVLAALAASESGENSTESGPPEGRLANQ